MYAQGSIKILHLEVTTKCNAACPMCPRTVQGGPANPHLPLVELSLNDARNFFPPDFLSQMNLIYLCGNYGDPAAASETLEILEYFRAMNPRLELQVFSNGGLRDSAWWERLAGLGVRVRFAIDGLEDTNHLYRRNVKWERVLASVRAFISAGGEAEWDFLVFQHNEDQVEEARRLSTELGFKKFFAKRTARFFDNKTHQVRDRYPVQRRDGSLEYYLRPAQEKAFRPPTADLGPMLAQDPSWAARYFSETEIQCKAVGESSIFVTADGLLFPCCWTANQMYLWYEDRRSTQIWRHIEAHLGGDLEKISLRRYGLAELLASPWMQSSFANSWAQPSVEQGRLKVCAKMCGQSLDSFRSQT